MRGLGKTPLKRRQKDILFILRAMGGIATTRGIAYRVGLNVNGVAQSLGALAARDEVSCLGGVGGDTEWMINVGQL